MSERALPALSGCQSVSSSGGNVVLRITYCSWDPVFNARAAGRRAVLKYGDALRRLADG